MPVPKPLPLIALGAFLAVDVALVALVYQHVNQEPPSSDVGATSAEASPTPSRETNQRAFDFKPATAASMDVANDGTWIFATRGSCDGDASTTVFTSTDNGADPAKRDPDLKVVTAVQAGSGGNLVVVGAGEDCVPVQKSSTDGGSTWTQDFEITRIAISPEDPKQVIAPGGETSEPGCTMSSLSQVGEDFARVTCIDGIVKGTGNGGEEWVDLGRLDNVRTATFTSFNAGYALARFEGCAAQVFSTKDSGRTWASASCIVGDPARAIAASDTALVAVVGDDPKPFLSTDGGQDFGAP